MAPYVTLFTSSPDTPATASMAKRTLSSSVKRREATLQNSSQLVTLFAGNGAEKFVVHKDFACHYSPVFQAAFSSQFVEGQTQEYRLKDTTAEAIRLLVNWFYTQKVEVRQLGPEGNFSTKEVNMKFKHHEDITLVELWVLADKLLLPRLQNTIVEEMQRLREQLRLAPINCYALAYEKTQEGSPLRRFLVDSSVGSSMQKPEFYECIEQFPKEMLMDMFIVGKAALPSAARKALRPEKGMAKYKVPEE
ncbi:hypothetical protein EG329_011515 [Mollisiaceae sp. DMI_Dod_QoI]|nr:hypothetical protein EG329_011515 [Helotiales sp. DMI_Dod_QoI]